MKKLIIAGCALALLLTLAGCSDNPDTVLGNDTTEQIEPADRAVSAKTSETGYAEKPAKSEVPEPGTGP